MDCDAQAAMAHANGQDTNNPNYTQRNSSTPRVLLWSFKGTKSIFDSYTSLYIHIDSGQGE